ncbi:ras and Rab interactor 2 isoform X2 [Brachyhypopomus gauderio]|uniref:ras and Rab interactor 2 isoform X2 n=1 Tax=Brachyhypopomus gauderio TaxID=698409 RepID=UPI0040415852
MQVYLCIFHTHSSSLPQCVSPDCLTSCCYPDQLNSFLLSYMTSVDDDEMSNGVSASHRSPVDLLQGLQLCQEAWAPGGPWDRHGAHAALWGRPLGSFLVVADSSVSHRLLCVSAGGRDQAVQDFPILLVGAALQLTASHLTFPDLLQLVAFYTLSRDVLPSCLLVPSWVHSLSKQPSHLLPQLGPKAWLCPSTELQLLAMTPVTTDSQDTVMCSIQLTTSSGALCIINPLYLHEHGDDWLARTSAGPQPASHSGHRRMSRARPWLGAGLKKRGSSLDESSHSSDQSGGAVQSPVSPVTTGGVVLRRSSTSTSSSVKRERVESTDSPLPQSPHRVSWVEDKFWLSPPPSSLLHPPCQELDSLSISSIEEEHEAEPTLSPSQSQHLPRLPLTNKVKNRLSAVGQALGSLMSPRRRLTKRVQEMSERRGGAFAEAVRGFVEQTAKASAAPAGLSPDALQEVRASLTALRETLYDYTEIQSITDTLTELSDMDLDGLLEVALHKVTLKSVFPQLYVGMKAARQANGSLRRLVANRDTLANHSLEELEGTVGTGVPDAAAMEKILQHWTTMHQAYSPNKKVETLLKVCKSVYHSMGANATPGVVFGADDFLPCLTWVLLRSDVATLQLETDYMMELLDPSQLQGEGGYYLTSLYAALFYISSYRPRIAARQLSAEAHKSLSQWHRRRTLHCNQSRRSKNRRTIRRHGREEATNDKNEAGHSLPSEDVESANRSVPDTPPSSDVATASRLDEDLSVVGEEEEEEERQPTQDQKNMNNQEP